VSDLGEVLLWDSAFFGRRVAKLSVSRLDRVTLDAVLRWSEEQRIEWLHFLADVNDAETVRLATGAGFELTDIRLELVLDLRWPRVAPVLPPPEIRIRSAGDQDLTYLQPIAAEVHTDSRFFHDSRVSSEDAVRLFETWIKRSCLEGFADQVLVAERGGQAVGYVTGSLTENGAGHIGLVGVATSVRGQGVGMALVQSIITWFADRECQRVGVVTQGRNITAQRLYQACGFRSQSVQLWFHRWFT
jgi:dTDP-4-amino-4,6-dideoxy-D-galactose acyltransferase